MKKIKLFTIITLTGILTSCTGYPRMVNYPFDPGGRSLNSPAEEKDAKITGKYIIFTSDRRGSQDIFSYDMVNRQLVDLPGLNSLEVIASHPSISTDGKYIVFAGSRRGKTGIYLYNRETRQLRNLTETLEAEVRNPSFSGDGNVIAFESSANGQWDILLCDRDGNLLNIPTNPQ